ncbi:MAG: host specificity factor TipJ family phage tail protein [Rhizomicrobium sp.]
MSAKLLYLANPLDPDAQVQHTDVSPGMLVTGAIDSTDWRLPAETVLWRGGTLVKRCNWDADPINDNEVAILATLPQDGGGSQVLRVLAMLALAVFAPGIGTALAGALGFTGSFAIGLATAAVLVAGQTLISALLPPPKSASNVTPSPTYSLSGGSNQGRIGQAIPELLGRNDIMCDLASAPFFDFAGNVERLYELFIVGIGEFDIHQMRIDTNIFWEDDVYTGTYPEIVVEIIPPGGDVTLFPTNVVTSTDVSSISLIGTNESGYTWSGPFVASGANTKASQLAIDIALPAGLYHLDSSNHLQTATVTFNFQAQKIDADGDPIGDYFDIIGGSASISGTLVLSSKDAVRQTLLVTMPTPARYRVRGERTNVKSSDNNTSDTLVWLAMRAYLPGTTTFPGLTLIAVQAQATFNLNGQSAQKFNVVATRKLPIYDADTQTWSAPTATRSIAAAAAYVLRSTNGAGLADGRIDLAKLAALQTTWTTRGDNFDGIFDTQKSLWEALQNVLQVGRARPFLVGSMVSFVRDEAQTTPRSGFSPRNMLPGSFAIDYAMYDDNAVDGLTVQFIDARTWTANQVFCALPDSTVTEDNAPTIQFFGITDRSQAWREGIYMCAANRYRREFPSFRTELEGRTLFLGQLVRVSHWLADMGKSADVLDLVEDEAGDILILSEPWSDPPDQIGETRLITLLSPDGRIWGPVPFGVVDDGSATRQAQVRLLDTADAGGKYAGLQPRGWGLWSGEGLQFERPRAVLGMGTNNAQDALVIAAKPEQGMTATISTVIEDARVHTADEGDPPVEINPPTVSGPDDLTITALNTNQVWNGGAYDWSVIAEGASAATSFQYCITPDGGSAGDWVGSTRDIFFTTSSGQHFTLEVQALGSSGAGDVFSEGLVTDDAPA